MPGNSDCAGGTAPATGGRVTAVPHAKGYRACQDCAVKPVDAILPEPVLANPFLFDTTAYASLSVRRISCFSVNLRTCMT